MTHHHPHPHLSIVEGSVDVAAPIDRVWAVVADPRNLPLWDRRVAAVEGVPEEGLGEGDEYVTEVRIMAVRVRVTAEVVEFRAPERSRVRLHGVIDAWVETTLQELDGDRTRLRQRVDYRFIGGPLGELTARAVQIMGAGYLLRRGIQAQKRQAERAATVRDP